MEDRVADLLTTYSDIELEFEVYHHDTGSPTVLIKSRRISFGEFFDLARRLNRIADSKGENFTVIASRILP